MKEQQMPIFIHIPKTGGTTLNTIFKSQYEPKQYLDHNFYIDRVTSFDQLTAAEKESIEAVAGHYFYGTHEYFPKAHRYFTMLRDPVDRVLSLYYFLQTYPGYERVREMTLEEYVKAEAEAYNFQTIMICGLDVRPSVTRAKKHLDTFAAVGITEMFDESIYLLQREFGWEHIHYKKDNITKKRKRKEQISPETISLIQEYNEMDQEVYEYAKQLLHRKLSSLTPSEQIQLANYKLDQKSYS